ncbi:MAG: SDR family NAD(P)-dependent oxidoreductase, partial [Gammaproteobacteria bacterium]|nr:SDR family NAD(P)-dependent oxidoreductase [Gammaproteobacteria bacterium]
MQIAGITAMVTGAGSGMGKATARFLAQEGASVALLDLNVDAAHEVASEIGGEAFACDVADATGAEQAVANAVDSMGMPRLLVNCAGIATGQRTVGRDGPMPLEDFKRVIDINLVGTFNMIRLAAARMFELDALSDSGERGVIVNTASVAGFEGQIGQAAYSASK